jgi:hypothetical protein
MVYHWLSWRAGTELGTLEADHAPLRTGLDAADIKSRRRQMAGFALSTEAAVE